MPTLTAAAAIEFLRRGQEWFAERGVQIRAVMSDNGSAYTSHAYRRALIELGLRHVRIRPYRPRTNGKAERFIQTLLHEWAYERIYGSSPERTAALPLFLERYNFVRPHGSLGHRPPVSRLTNVVGNYTQRANDKRRLRRAARARATDVSSPAHGAAGRYTRSRNDGLQPLRAQVVDRRLRCLRG